MDLILERYQELVEWVQEGDGNNRRVSNDGTRPCLGLHPSIEIYHDDTTKGSLRVKEGCSLSSKWRVASIPLCKTLSYLNAINISVPGFDTANVSSASFPQGNSPLFPRSFLENCEPHVICRFFLMQQYLLGPSSLWYPYIRTLPQPEHVVGMLPALWPQSDLDFLVGTNAYNAALGSKKFLKAEFKKAKQLLLPAEEDDSVELGKKEAIHVETYTAPLYFWAYAIFTSRSFRPSLVIADAEEVEKNLGCNINDFSVLVPLYDLANHDPTAHEEWNFDKETQACNVSSRGGYSSGEQVYINYGPKTNTELLVGYGFVLQETGNCHNDYAHILTRGEQDGYLDDTHLVSLRPMYDESSLVGRIRRKHQVLPDSVEVIPEFTHLEAPLLGAIYHAIWSASTRPGEPDGDKRDWEEEEPALADIVSGKISAEMKQKLIQALGSKISYDLEALDCVEVPREGLNANQRLAVHHRDQHRQVLVNALKSLISSGTEDKSEASPESENAD